jgi:hypothetical protein
VKAIVGAGVGSGNRTPGFLGIGRVDEPSEHQANHDGGDQVGKRSQIGVSLNSTCTPWRRDAKSQLAFVPLQSVGVSGDGIELVKSLPTSLVTKDSRKLRASQGLLKEDCVASGFADLELNGLSSVWIHIQVCNDKKPN